MYKLKEQIPRNYSIAVTNLIMEPTYFFDKRIWEPDDHVVFSVKSFYRRLMSFGKTPWGASFHLEVWGSSQS